MASTVKGFLKSVKGKVNGKMTGGANGFAKAPDCKDLFPKTDPTVDGEECLHDCSTCTIHYPKKFSIEEKDALYGEVNGWETHLVVATGKTDWTRDVEDEKGSIMEAVSKSQHQPTNGKMKLSASNMPLPYCLPNGKSDPRNLPSTVLLLPAFELIENVTPANTPDLIRHCISLAPTNTSPLNAAVEPTTQITKQLSDPTAPPEPAPPTAFQIRPCPHKYLILLCSQRTRDARCGQSAPLLRREFERHLRPLGLYRDLSDERPGGVGIYFISHVGGHKYSANVIIYRRADAEGVEKPEALENGQNGEKEGGQLQAAQCIWLARVRPEQCENIVRYTVLKGKVLDPERQLRGGFDRSKQLVSW